MIPGFEYGYAQGEHVVWCIHPDGNTGLMLCGRKVGFVPVVQPEHPTVVHRDCLEAMYGSPKRNPAAVGYATCPAREGAAPVFEGRIEPHGAWKVSGDGPYQSDEACVGVNMAPKQGRR